MDYNFIHNLYQKTVCLHTYYLLFFNYFISILGFSERGREGRLIRLVSDTMEQDLGTTMGVGVDENTALVVYNVAGATQYGEVN